MKKILFGILFLGLCVGLVASYFFFLKHTPLIRPISKGVEEIAEKPLDKYTFDNLKKKTFLPSKLSLGKKIKDEQEYSSYLFYYTVEGKKVSGLMNIPKKPGVYPVIVLIRGFVPKAIFTSGEGSRRTGEYLATQGFITLAPDFLGYGDSDNPSKDSMEERFQTYPTAITLLNSIKNLDTILKLTDEKDVLANEEKIGIWGHSNGGHIALSVLSITEKPYPTVLWNPVSSVFPYSILYFIDEYDDHGKGLIRLVADFQKYYDTEKYSPPNYYKYIKAPIQLHQAMDDVEVPVKWSTKLYNDLKDLGVPITYYTYPGENHNFNNGSWSEAIVRTKDFYHTQFEK